MSEESEEFERAWSRLLRQALMWRRLAILFFFCWAATIIWVTAVGVWSAW